ncbi:MAG: hypothetical protein JSR77_11385 [Planctomycetes bacterium]|nr:hypothetical protein [Planctomycetota bacterium]
MRTTLGMLRGMGVCAALWAAGASAGQGTDLKRDFQARWAENRFDAAAGILEDAFKSSPEEAMSLAVALVETGNDFSRPVGAAAIVAHADVKTLAGLAKRLSRTEFPDERRLFVRALGVRAVEARKGKEPDAKAVQEVSDAAGAFVNDTDTAVAASAILALADTGDIRNVGRFIDEFVDVPAFTSKPPGNDRNLLSRACAGAFKELTGERPKSLAEVKQWWAANKNDPKKKEKGPLPESDNWSGQKFCPVDRFNLFYRIGSKVGEVAEGPLSPAEIGPALAAAAARAEQVLRPVLGTAHVPELRVYLCDPNQFNAKASNRTFAGQTQGNEIILKVENVKAVPQVMWHEYIHAIHDSNFSNQPRWLSEGVAMSYTISAKGKAPRELDANMQVILKRGAFTEMINWNSGGSGDSLEGARYATAHLCIDYLRFSGFGAADTRIFYVMARLSRHQAARLALESVYGKSIKDMDQAVREFVK